MTTEPRQADVPVPPTYDPPVRIEAEVDDLDRLPTGWSSELAQRYSLVPSSARPGLQQYLRQLWERRHFLVAFANARVVSLYTSARLGQIWQLLTPLLNAGVYLLLF